MPQTTVTATEIETLSRPGPRSVAWVLLGGLALGTGVALLQWHALDQLALIAAAGAHAAALPALLGGRIGVRQAGGYGLGLSLPPWLLLAAAPVLPAVLTAAASAAFGLCLHCIARRADGVLGLLEALGRLRAELSDALGGAEEELARLRIEVRTGHEQQRELEARVERTTSELARVERKAQSLSTVLQRVMPYEPETGLLTAEKFEAVLAREWARMRRQEQPLTLLVLGLDHFEAYCERAGRIAAEAALRRVAGFVRQAGQRPGDVAARLDRERLALLFPEADQQHGAKIAQKLCTRIRQLGLPCTESPGGRLTASVGVAGMIPTSQATPAELRQRADAALYEARFQGGDCSVRHRLLEGLRLERWNIEQEGLLTAEGLERKLALLGYRARQRTLQPGEAASSRRLPVETVEAVVDGALRVSLEGESKLLRPGDCLFVPKGQVASLEAVGATPTVCLEATPD